MNNKLFSERISESIKSSGLSQKQIARKLGISKGNVTNWKKGNNMPSIAVFYELCVILQESADYLLGLKDD